MRYYNKYIVTKRFKGITASGNLNLPYGTECFAESVGTQRAIFCDKGLVCYVDSQVAYDYFAHNDDGNGFERGRLTAAIIARLSKKDKMHQERWDKIWDDPCCQKYKRSDYSDRWFWNYDFYNAPLSDLQHIARLVGVK